MFDGRMLDGLISFLLIAGAILGAAAVAIVWLLVSYVLPHIHIAWQ